MPFKIKSAVVSSGDGRNFVLVEPLVYVRSDGEEIIVPPGDASDGASTPRFIWDIVPPFGLHWLPAIVHDHLYRRTDKPKKFCDETFLEAMTDMGVPEFERLTIYEGVVIGGEKSFSEDRKVFDSDSVGGMRE